MVNFNPNISVKVNENTAFAFGIDFYEVKSLALNTASVKIEGSGDGMGFNLGLLHKINRWTLGGSYRSAVDTDLTGTVGGSSALPAPAIPVSAKIEFPDMLQIGVRYQATDDVSVEFDIEHTGWKFFDKIEVKAQTGGTLVTQSENQWDDALAYRLGVTYDVTDKTQLRFGYALDETPQPDKFYTARIPGADRQLFSIGIAHELEGWAIEAGYMLAVLDDRTINSTDSFAARAAGGNTDPNGSDAFNGKYESDVNLLGVGVTIDF